MPTVKGIAGAYRLYSFDCNEPSHVHVQRENKVCKFWLEPTALGKSVGFSAVELNAIRHTIEHHRSKILEAWDDHCGEQCGATHP